MQPFVVFGFLFISSCLAQAKSYKTELRFNFSPPTIAKDSYEGPIRGHEAIFIEFEAPNFFQAEQKIKAKIGKNYTQDFRVYLDPKSKLCECMKLDTDGRCKIGDKSEKNVTYKNITISQETRLQINRCEAIISSAKIVGADLYENSRPICHIGDSLTSGVAVCGSQSKGEERSGTR